MANFVVLAGGRQSGPTMFTMSVNQPMTVGLECGYDGNGTAFEVNCNDFQNASGAAVVEPLDPGGSSPAVRKFNIRPRHEGYVMLEARLPQPDSSFLDWPRYAWVQIKVWIDSAAEAKKRCDGFATKVIPTTPSPIGKDPSGRVRMDSAVWTALLNFTRQFEGPTDFMYNDRSRPKQLVTCAFGRMFPDEAEAVKNKQFFHTPAGAEPSGPEMIEDYNGAHGLARSDVGKGNLFDFAEVTRLRLTYDKMVQLLSEFMAGKVRQMLTMPAFANFADFPADAKVACASISYGSMWAGPLVAAMEAVRAQDWAKAAAVYKSPGWGVKDDAHKALFLKAAQAQPLAKPPG